MLELHVPETHVARGAVQVTWTVDRDTLRTLDGHPGEAFALIVTAPADKAGDPAYEGRKLVPLTDGQAFIGFRRPGPHAVWAIPVIGDRALIEDAFLRRSGGSWRTDVIARAEKIPFQNAVKHGSYLHQLAGSAEIVVPKECFAPPPSPAMLAWATWLLRDKGEDQCGFRRRLLFAFTLQLFVLFPIYYAARLLVAALFFLGGNKGFPYGEMLLHPLRSDFGSCVNAEGQRTVFWREDLPDWLKPIVLACMPLIQLAGAGFAALSLTGPHKHLEHWWQPFFWGPLVVTGLGIAGMIVVAAVLAIMADVARRHARRESEAPTTTVRMTEEQVVSLSDERGVGHPALGRRFVLRFEGLKARMCKPFAG